MSELEACPLTPALLRLIGTCVEIDSVRTGDLAPKLCLSPHTVDTEFQRACRILGATSRMSAVLLSLRHGWIEHDAGAGPAHRHAKYPTRLAQSAIDKIV